MLDPVLASLFDGIHQTVCLPDHIIEGCWCRIERDGPDAEGYGPILRPHCFLKMLRNFAKVLVSGITGRFRKKNYELIASEACYTIGRPADCSDRHGYCL